MLSSIQSENQAWNWNKKQFTTRGQNAGGGRWLTRSIVKLVAQIQARSKPRTRTRAVGYASGAAAEKSQSFRSNQQDQTIDQCLTPPARFSFHVFRSRPSGLGGPALLAVYSTVHYMHMVRV